MTLRPLALIAALALAGALAACATPTGPDAARTFDLYEAAPGLDFSRYETVFVAPVAVSDEIASRVGYRPRRFDDKRPLGQRELDAKVEDLEVALKRELGTLNALSETSGPGILTVETLLTGLDSNRPTQAEMSAVPGLDFRSISLGGASVRVTLSENGRQLAVIEDEARNATLDDPSIGVTTWGEVDRFFSSFSARLAGLVG